jgi:hypothetical protein
MAVNGWAGQDSGAADADPVDPGVVQGILVERVYTKAIIAYGVGLLKGSDGRESRKSFGSSQMAAIY